MKIIVQKRKTFAAKGSAIVNPVLIIRNCEDVRNTPIDKMMKMLIMTA